VSVYSGGARLSFKDTLLSFFAGDAGPVASTAIRQYFEDHYTGSQFERLADGDANRITANDIVAVSMLGVDVPPAVSVWLLGSDGQDAVGRHLSSVPTNVDIRSSAGSTSRCGC